MFNLDLIWTDAIVFDFIAAIYLVSAAITALVLIVTEVVLGGRKSAWHHVAYILVGATLVGLFHAAFVVLMLGLMTGGS